MLVPDLKQIVLFRHTMMDKFIKTGNIKPATGFWKINSTFTFKDLSLPRKT
jgi:hypothetical protein